MDGIDVILAECEGLGRVRLCECNSIHLTIGPVTLHLEKEALAQTTILLNSAMEQLTELLRAGVAAKNPLEFPKPLPRQVAH
jgi:hypothetical protein